MSSGVHIFWILSRGAGIAAILFAGMSVIVGLISGRDMPFAKLRKNFELRALHEALSITTIVLVVAHGLILLGDPWLKPGLTGISVPFVMSYRSFWTGFGIIAGYGLVLLGLSFYLRRWIGPARWRTAHRFIAVFWLLGLVHTFGSGTDATQPWVWIPVALVSVPALVLLFMRMAIRHGRPAPARVSKPPASARPVTVDRP